MGNELDLMRNYPKSMNRLKNRVNITNLEKEVSRRFDKEYFDGDRKYGYGGYQYDEKFWTTTVKDFATYYNLEPSASILDIGCAKGYMLKDFRKLLPKSKITGLDISQYAIKNSDPEVRENLIYGNASSLPFPDKSFDLVISINTLHNLERWECIKSLTEIERVTKGNSFIMVDGWRNELEKEALDAWVLTARTVLSADKWIELFQEAGYSGDYAFWTV